MNILVLFQLFLYTKYDVVITFFILLKLSHTKEKPHTATKFTLHVKSVNFRRDAARADYCR